MKEIFVKDILDVTKGQLIIGNKNTTCQEFSKDTRDIKKGDVYVGIKGEKFDGNNLWKEAIKKGASVVIVSGVEFKKEDLLKIENKTIIKVEDTIKAIGEIAKYKRSLYNIPIIAITGSVGKTSTKDIIANVVAQKYKTLKTKGNLNNHIGVPFTLFRLKDQEAAVIEMGMNHLEEISYLTKITKPTIATITNIGTSHIGNLGSRENILKAKLEILEGMDEKKLIINNDNDMLNKYYEYNSNNKNKIDIETFGIKNKSDVMAEEVILKENYSEFICKTKKDKFKVKVPIGGEHFVYNALCAITIGIKIGITNDQIIKGIENFELTQKRMDIEILKNGTKIINDSYNASFESMKAALKYLAGFENSRKIAVLGDMFELGKFSDELHKQIGKEVKKNKIDILIALGKNAKNIVESAKKAGMQESNIFYFIDKEELVKFVYNKMKKEDVILFKAANGLKFFDLVQKLKEM